MAVTIQVKRGSRATLPVLALGEYGLTTDTKELFIGGPEGVNIQIAVLDNGGQIPEEQLPEMDVSQTLAQAELKDPPVDGDGVLVTDSAAGNATKRVLWSRIKAALKGYFDPLYAAKSHTHSKAQITDFPASLPANGGNAATVGGLSSDQLIAQAVAKGCRIATCLLYTSDAADEL